MFRIYVLWRIAQMHAGASQSFHVVWQKVGLRVLYLMYDATAGIAAAEKSYEIQSFDRVLLHPPADHTVYYILDGMSPKLLRSLPKEVHVLQVSSPHPSTWKEFRKQQTANLVTRFMPLVSLAELISMKKMSNYSTDEIRERYRLLGGSTRNVLRSHNSARAIIKEAFMASDGLDGIIGLGHSVLQASVDVSSALIHLSVNEEEDLYMFEDMSAICMESVAPYSKPKPVFASRYVRHQVTLRREKLFVTVLRELMSSTSMMYTSPMQGPLYEDYVNSRIVRAAPNMCKKKDLTSASTVETQFSFSGQTVVEFDDLAELHGKLAVNTTYHPMNQGFGAVNFVAMGVVGNMSLNIRHGISLTKLEKVADFLIGEQAPGAVAPMPLEFWWVVPSRKQYDKFTNQPLMFEGKVATVEQQASFAAKVALRQFVVLMRPDDTVERKHRSTDGSEEKGSDDDDDDEQMVEDSEKDEASRSTTRRTSRKLATTSDAATSSRKRSASQKH